MTREENALFEKLDVLYEFAKQGSICASEEYSRAAFELVKHRMEMLFPEAFQVEKDDCNGNEERTEDFPRELNAGRSALTLDQAFQGGVHT